MESLVLFISMKSQIPLMAGERHFAKPPKFTLPEIVPSPPRVAKPDIICRRLRAVKPEMISRPSSAAIQVELE